MHALSVSPPVSGPKATANGAKARTNGEPARGMMPAEAPKPGTEAPVEVDGALGDGLEYLKNPGPRFSKLKRNQTPEQDFKLALACKRFLYTAEGLLQKDKAKLQQEILDKIFAKEAVVLYEEICAELGWEPDAGRLEAMRAASTAALAALEEKIKDAQENLGDVEVRDALAAKAEHLCRIGDRAAAREAFAVAEAKTAGVGQKMDLAFSLLRLDMAAGDWQAVKLGLKHAEELCAGGGDWERKNRLRVYEAVLLLATRDLARAASLLLDSIATFTSTELFSYEDCIFYTVVTSVATLPRTELKARVVDAPEILTVIDAIPHLAPFLTALYACDYKTLFQAFAALMYRLRADRLLAPHFRYYVREVRVVAYTQFLEAYKSVTLESMAAAFGVSPAFMDAELAEFIVAGRVSAKIDKVAGVIETNRPDAKNAQYQATLKQGDLLLNRLQKLSRAIDVE
ncbi:hypothetical protein WJX81_001490 [Elliptochloris bilobata]|uniref:26S proteasome regulatory subunit RPN7 n=1 Tax=Elliptochloris bilobata TaxID=381761 RepID=A0AAW1S869_9CHLO